MEKYELFRKLARDFAEKELAPVAERIDETGEFPAEIRKKMAACGFFGIKIPKELGGGGSDCMAYVIVTEELAKVCCVSTVFLTMANTLVGETILHYGTPEQKKKYLPPVIRGEKICCFALTEPGAGSDAGGIMTTATEDGDEYILNGLKCFITGAPLADNALIFAKTDPKAGTRGITAFIIDMKLPGITCGKPEKKMGILGCPTSDVIMENVRVPKSAVLGEVNKGFGMAMNTLNTARIGCAAQAIGVAKGAFEAAVQYSKDRKQFGSPISNFQSIAFMLAEMDTKLETSRLLVYEAAKAVDEKRPSTRLSAMAKYYCCETAVNIVSDALQIHGGYGYIKDYPIERMYRDVRIMPIYEGTSQVQKMVISSLLLKQKS